MFHVASQIMKTVFHKRLRVHKMKHSAYARFSCFVNYWPIANRIYQVDMENLILRFSHLVIQIFEKLDNKSLTKCREVRKSWQKFIDENNIVWIRIVNIPSVPKNGNTFLHIATRTGQIGITELILSEDCEVNPKNNAGQS